MTGAEVLPEELVKRFLLTRAQRINLAVRGFEARGEFYGMVLGSLLW